MDPYSSEWSLQRTIQNMSVTGSAPVLRTGKCYLWQQHAHELADTMLSGTSQDEHFMFSLIGGRES